MSHNNQILVEGGNDLHVISSLMKYFNIPKTFDVTDCKSIDNVLGRFKLYLEKEASRIKKLAIVIDADFDTQRRWDSIKHIIITTKAYN